MNKKQLIVARVILLISMIFPGCVTLAQQRQIKLLEGRPVYYCEECRLYFAFKSIGFDTYEHPKDYDYHVGIGEIKASCPICDKSMEVKKAPKGEYVIIIKNEYRPWRCGTPSTDWRHRYTDKKK